MKKENFCFEKDTFILFKNAIEATPVIDTIRRVYRDYENETIYVPVMTFNEFEHKSVLNWVPAKLCQTKTIQSVVVHLTTCGSEISPYENDYILRLTPNHILPILTKHGYTDKEAYLLQTGDVLITEAGRISVVNEDEAVAEVSEENMDKWLVEENSEHYTAYRSIAKVVIEDIAADDEWNNNYYGITLLNGDNDSKYFMLANAIISHDSSVTY